MIELLKQKITDNMKTKNKLKLLEIILDKAASDEWYIEDVIYCYDKLYKTLKK